MPLCPSLSFLIPRFRILNLGELYIRELRVHDLPVYDLCVHILRIRFVVFVVYFFVAPVWQSGLESIQLDSY